MLELYAYKTAVFVDIDIEIYIQDVIGKCHTDSLGLGCGELIEDNLLGNNVMLIEG